MKFLPILACSMHYFMPVAAAGHGVGHQVVSEVEKLLDAKFLQLNEDDFRKDIIDRHNHYRSLHGVPPLTTNSSMEATALKWAKHLASRIEPGLEHSKVKGENLFGSTGTVTGSLPVDRWYSEIKKYDFKEPGFSEGTGHFTQLVWKASKALGCAKAKSEKNGWTFVVCNYEPPGNVIGQFKDNVPPPLQFCSPVAQ